MSLGLDPFEGSGVETATMIEDVLPSIVQVRSGANPRRGAGAGFLWSPDDTVMTNYHVVAGSRRKAEVDLTDDRSFDVEVVQSSRRLDLAMLQLRNTPAEGLPTPSIGDSDALRVGELIFAVGHPWGRRGAVTAGIVSGFGTVGGHFGGTHYIQSDAYLAPGNSGGPLVNARGEVVGVNAMVSGGLALALPSNTASAWVSGGIGSVRRPRLGVRMQEAALPASLQDSTGQKIGLVIASVNPRSLAARAGLLVGDVLLSVASVPVEDVASLRGALVRAASAGDAVRLRVMRGGEMREINVDLKTGRAWRRRA